MKRPWPLRHLGLKLLAIALAVLLWMTVSGEETAERGLRVPLELQQVPAGLELTGDIPTTVDVRVRAAPGFLVGGNSADRKSVDVVGPDSAVRNVTEVLTEPVSVAGARAPVTQTVLLGLLDSSLRLKNTRSATVTVQIVPAPVERGAHS